MFWQDFTVTGGHIARNNSNQFEGILELTASDGSAHRLSLVFDEDGALWGWGLTGNEEPEFIHDREEDEDEE